MRVALLLFLLVASPVLSAQPSGKSEMQVRREVSEQTGYAFIKSDFTKLDQVADRYRMTKARSDSGLWLLTLFDAGISEAIDRERGDPSTPDAGFPELEKKTASWVRARPESPSAHLAHARVHLAHAWAYRGSGYSHTVDANNWAPFNKYLSKARRYLELHKKIASVDPRWYETMLLIATAQNWERPKFERLLAEALEREPLFYQTYFNALDYLLPKWHGDVTEVEAFAQSAVKRTLATEGRGMYARIYWFASQSQFDNRLFEDSKVDWPRMREGFDDVVARYPDAWNMTNFAKFACLAGDQPKAREMLKRVGEHAARQAWSTSRDQNECIRFALPPTPPGRST